MENIVQKSICDSMIYKLLWLRGSFMECENNLFKLPTPKGVLEPWKLHVFGNKKGFLHGIIESPQNKLP